MPIPLFKSSDKDITLFVGVFFVALGFETIKFCGVEFLRFEFLRFEFLCYLSVVINDREPIDLSARYAWSR